MGSQTVKIPWDTVGPFFVWQFLIPLASGWVQTILYGIFIRAGDPKPQPGSPRYVRHRRNLLIAIYIAYFLFTIYEVDHTVQQTGNAYNDLGLPISVDDGAIQSRFRKLTMRFHPDKVGPGVNRDKANEYYVHLKHSRDIIIDPVKRFAYDRFGPEILQQCRHCLTIRDYVSHALLVILWSYGPLVAILFAINTLGFLKDGIYWRYLAILALVTLEVRTAMRPDHPPILTKVINPLLAGFQVRPPYLPFQAITLLRRSSLQLAQFLGLLIPLYRQTSQPQRAASGDGDSEEARHKQLDRLAAFSREAQLEAGRLLELEGIPFKQDERMKGALREALKKFMVQNVVHQEKEVRNAMGASMARRRVGAPVGARGNR